MSRSRSCVAPYPSLLGDAHGADGCATCSILGPLSGVQPESPRVTPLRSGWGLASRLAPAFSALTVLAALAAIGATMYLTRPLQPERAGGAPSAPATPEQDGRRAATEGASAAGRGSETAAIIVGAHPDAVQPVARAGIAAPSSVDASAARVQPAAGAVATARPRATAPGAVSGGASISGAGRERGATRPRSPAPRSRAAEVVKRKPQPDPDVDIVTVIVERSSARR